MAKTEKKNDEGKRLKYRIEGTIEITDIQPLERALEQVKTLSEAAKAFGEATIGVSVPRLTNVKL